MSPLIYAQNTCDYLVNNMKFIMIYGPSGIGKESIGRELASQPGWKLFPQHLAFDVACAVVGFVLNVNCTK